MNNRLYKVALAALIAAPLGLGVLLMQPSVHADNTSAASAPDPMQFARGAKSWANNCARCHNMRNPNEMRDDQWRAVVSHMRVRAGLTGEEAREILTFLQGSN